MQHYLQMWTELRWTKVHTECTVQETIFCSLICPCTLQAYAVSAPPDSLLEDHLMQAGISVRSSAIVWLTPAQLLEVEKELEQMEMTFSFETTAWWLSDVLARARITNNRMPQSSANSW